MSEQMKNELVKTDEVKVPNASKKVVKKPQTMKEKMSRLVRGRFNFHECPGGILKFSTHFFKPDKGENAVEDWTFIDGEIRTIPYYLYQHLNQNVSYPEHEYLPGYEKVLAGVPAEGGNNIPMRVKRMVRRVSFERLDFDDEEIVPRQIVEVERASLAL